MRPWHTAVRDWLSFTLGASGVVHEVWLAEAERPYLVALLGLFMGAPGVTALVNLLVPAPTRPGGPPGESTPPPP